MQFEAERYPRDLIKATSAFKVVVVSGTDSEPSPATSAWNLAQVRKRELLRFHLPELRQWLQKLVQASCEAHISSWRTDGDHQQLPPAISNMTKHASQT